MAKKLAQSDPVRNRIRSMSARNRANYQKQGMKNVAIDSGQLLYLYLYSKLSLYQLPTH